MKNYNFLKFFTLLLLSVVFIQCTSDPVMGPAGADGTNGIDGANGANGADGATGTATCVSCHSESHRDPIESSFLMSGHFKGEVYLTKGSASCSQCHTNDGYLNYLEGKPGITDASPAPISCTTCHDTHGTFDFETDGYDYALRALKPVTLIVDETTTLDYGHSNACITCHQPKGAAPVNDGSDLFNITSPYYGPHYGAQTTMLEGIQGAEIAGSIIYDEEFAGIDGSATHRTSASCTSCHMGSANENDGEHTMKPTLNTCIKCHGDATYSEEAGFTVHGGEEVAKLIALFDDLEALLLAKNVIAANSYGSLSVVPGEYSFKLTQAYWNWKFVKQDGSHGIHNPKYATALLTNSIEYVKAN